MTKKKETKKVEVKEPQIQDVVETPRVVEKPQPIKIKKEEKKLSTELEEGWEIKDRVYRIVRGFPPLSYSIRTSGIFWFDEEKGYERELKYTSNQRTCFVDEMIGDQRLAHVIFRNGFLVVPKNKVVLQKLLSLYHPQKDTLFFEEQPAKQAASELDVLELEIKALTTAKDLDIDMVEAVLRVEKGSEVSKMSSKELKRDLLLYAKKNPQLFLDLVNDENVVLRNFGIRATEMGILKLSSDQRTFKWGSNDRKLMNVPFDEHPYSALASWFKTDEGMEIFSNIEKRLNS